MDFLLLLIGLAGLWFGTEITIRGAVSVAKRFGVSEFIVGVAILSIGSDLPELAIAIDGAIKNLNEGDASGVVVGSALGSSLGQIGFVLGVVALMSLLTLPRGTVYRHGSILLGSLVLLALVGYDGQVTRNEGFVLLLLYGVYFVALLSEVNGGNGADDKTRLATFRSVVYLLVGLAVVVGSADLTVSSALNAAETLDISETFVAIDIIGLGTSLPELTISIGAVLKGRNRMSVGNLIGSNIFDTLVPIGAAAVIAGLSFDRGMLMFELPYLFVLSAVVLFFFARKGGIQRREAAVILGMYGAYVAVKVYDLGG